jgi:hypothetical protein
MDRPVLEVADIFRAFGPAYRRTHTLRLEEHNVDFTRWSGHAV